MQKRHYYMCVITITSKNIGGTLFVAFYFVNRFFVLFSLILTCKSINDTYPVAVYTLNTPSTTYFFFSLTAENVPFTFGVVLRPSKYQPYLCSNFETSNYVRRTLFLVCLPLNTLFLLFLGILICNCISGTYLVGVYILNTSYS